MRELAKNAMRDIKARILAKQVLNLTTELEIAKLTYPVCKR
jgi:hypothetical protein